MGVEHTGCSLVEEIGRRCRVPKMRLSRDPVIPAGTPLRVWHWGWSDTVNHSFTLGAGGSSGKIRTTV